jgi:hypothetical protein
MYTTFNVQNIYLNNLLVYLRLPVAVAERSEAWTVFDRSEAVNAASNPALGMDV